MLNAAINDSRYSGDQALLESLRSDPALQAALTRFESPEVRDRKRSYYLASGVRISGSLVPALSKTLDRLRTRTGLTDALEAYVLPDQNINAGMTRGAPHALLVLHAGAINHLTEDELLFVIGHELGHAMHNHIDVPEQGAMRDSSLGPRQRLQLFAWSRAAEISADRVGLLCCGNLDAAVSATFKVASGITVPGYTVDAGAFAAQWDDYAEEVMDVGSDIFGGELTHPLPHLRMKALTLYWNAGLAEGDASTPRWSDARQRVDAEVERLLSMLDPLAREDPDGVDPLLAEFFLWGGLYIALAHGEVADAERARIGEMSSRRKVQAALRDGTPSPDHCLEQFRATIASRRQKLSASEIFRIMEGLVQIALSDQNFDPAEREALHTIANTLGVSAELIIARHINP